MREHAGVAGLISAAGGQEAAALLATLLGSRRALRFGQCLSPSVRGDDGREIGELLGLEREELIAGLRRLQGAGRALALADERRHLGTGGVAVADDAGLDRKRTSLNSSH